MSIAKYELNCIFADHIVLVKYKKIQVIDMFRKHIKFFQTPSFPSTQPCLPKAAPKGCGCVSTNSCINKNTGFPGISTAKN